MVGRDRFGRAAVLISFWSGGRLFRVWNIAPLLDEFAIFFRKRIRETAPRLGFESNGAAIAASKSATAKRPDGRFARSEVYRSGFEAASILNRHVGA